MPRPTSPSVLAAEWRQRIKTNLTSGRLTEELDATFGRYTRYCDVGDSFMAGVALGEWVGLALRVPADAGRPSFGPAATPRSSEDVPFAPPIDIRPWGDGWRVSNESREVLEGCEARSGDSTVTISRLDPDGAIIVNVADFRPALASRIVLTVICRANGSTVTAREQN